MTGESGMGVMQENIAISRGIGRLVTVVAC